MSTWKMETDRSRRWEQWRSNVKALQLRVKDRLRIASFPTTRRAHGNSHIFSRQVRGGKAVVVYAQATGLVGAARVFKDNVVFRNALHSLASQLRSTFNIAAFSDRCTASLPCSPANTQNQAPRIRRAVDEQTEINYDAIFGENSYAVNLLQKFFLPVIGNVCHAFMHGFNQTEIYGAEKLVEAVAHRPSGHALITVSNHVASMDDPLVLAAVLPPRVLFDVNALRWTLCATDRCFTNRVTSAFFRCVKVLPVDRGGGVYQKGVDLAVEKLKRGDWVHVFPEGSRSRDGGRSIQAAKKGIGRLVVDAGKEPIVIPFVHSGMQEVMPIGSKFPAIRKRVVVLVGDPIIVNDLIAKHGRADVPDVILYEAIALRVCQHLKFLKAELDQLVTRDAKDNIAAFNAKRNGGDYMTNENCDRYDLSHWDEHGARRVSLGILEEIWLSESRRLAAVHVNNLQESVVTRLQRFKDRASLLGFAAQGLLRHG